MWKRALMLLAFQTVFGMSTLAADAKSGPFRIAYNSSWPPYSSQRESVAVGILPDLMNELLDRRLGLAVEHVPLPWKRAQAVVWAGEADAFVTVPTAERRELGLIGIEPAIRLRLQPVIAADARDLEDGLLRLGANFNWKGRRFCHNAGSGWHTAYAAAHGIEPFIARDVDTCVRMIAAGRVDGMIQAKAVARSSLHKFGLRDRVKLVATDIESWDFHLILGRSVPEGDVLLSRLDRLLRDMRASGDLERIWAEIEDRNIGE